MNDIAAHMIGKFVVIRTTTAGVHIGTLRARSGTEVVLENARRIWEWEGAFTLSEVSQTGINKNSKLSAYVPEILLTEAIEVLPCSDAARTILTVGIDTFQPV